MLSDRNEISTCHVYAQKGENMQTKFVDFMSRIYVIFKNKSDRAKKICSHYHPRSIHCNVEWGPALNDNNKIGFYFC